MLSYLLAYNRYMNIFGIIFLVALAMFASNNRKKINVRLVLNGLVLQFLTAYFILKTSVGAALFGGISDGVGSLYVFALQGVNFVFGALADPSGPWGFVFAFRVLPIIVFFGAFMSLLFHLGIIQIFVSLLSKIVRPLLGTSGVETLCAIANSFLGQTEAPLLIRHYLADVTRSEIMVIMTSGFATISAALITVYAAMGVPTLHILSASVMAIPGSLLMAKILYPETEKSAFNKDTNAKVEVPTKNILDALAVGTVDGLHLAMNVGAMLIAFLGIIALGNALLGQVSLVINYGLLYAGFSFAIPQLSLNVIFGFLFAPIAYALGFVGNEAFLVGQLLGTKLGINEFIAFDSMLKMGLSDRTIAVLTYALCSFANFSCIGIQIGGIGALVPSKRAWLSELGLRAVFAATLANLVSACMASLLL